MNEAYRGEISLLLLAPSQVLSVVLQHELRSFGYQEIVLAYNIEQAIQRLLQQPIDALICSMYFEDGDIFDLINALKKNKHIKPVELLLVSSEQREEKIELAIQAGVKAALSRPFQADELKNHLAHIIPSDL